MKLEFVSVISTDQLQLPGLLYTPEKPTNKVAVWLHGMGDSGIFYNPDRINTLGQALTKQGIALLAFNNRGAHNSKWLRIVGQTQTEDNDGLLIGTNYELIADCLKDIDGAVALLKQRSFKDLYLMGHSSGANKVCVYHDRAQNSPFSKYVLAGPDDDNGIWYDQLGERKFKLALNYAAKAVKKGQGHKTMPKYTGMYPFSAQATADILNPDGDYNTFPFYETTTKRLGKKPLFKEYGQIKQPVLVIFGQNDEFTYTAGGTEAALKIFRKFTNPAALPKSNFELLPDADHSFHGHEAAFAGFVARWLKD